MSYVLPRQLPGASAASSYFIPCWMLTQRHFL